MICSPPTKVDILYPVAMEASDIEELQARIVHLRNDGCTEEELHTLTHRLVVKNLVFVRTCTDAAITFVTKDQGPLWAQRDAAPTRNGDGNGNLRGSSRAASAGPRTFGRPLSAGPSAGRVADFENAKKLLKLAEITLSSNELMKVQEAEVAFAQRWDVSGVARAAKLLQAFWPLIILHAAGCTVHFLGGNPRRAEIHSSEACAKIQQCVIEYPHLLIPAALLAGAGQRVIAEQCVAMFASHGAVLKSMCRLDEALRFAQLAAALAHQLHNELLMGAANELAAMEGGGRTSSSPSNNNRPGSSAGSSKIPNYRKPQKVVGKGWSMSPDEAMKASPYATEASLLQKDGSGSSLFDEVSGSFISPSMLAQRSPTALLTAIALHNCVCIMRQILFQKSLPCIQSNPDRAVILDTCSPENQLQLVKLAIDLAVAEVGEYNAFVDRLRDVHQEAVADLHKINRAVRRGEGGATPAPAFSLDRLLRAKLQDVNRAAAELSSRKTPLVPWRPSSSSAARQGSVGRGVRSSSSTSDAPRGIIRAPTPGGQRSPYPTHPVAVRGGGVRSSSGAQRGGWLAKTGSH